MKVERMNVEVERKKRVSEREKKNRDMKDMARDEGQPPTLKKIVSRCWCHL